MTARSRAKRHHTVTRSYLELFADEDGRVAVFDKETGKDYSTDPINAAVIGDFNTVRLPGIAADSVEAALAAGEGPAVAAIKRLQGSTFADAEERNAIAWFVALHFARSPTFRRFCDDLASSVQTWIGEMSEAALGGMPTGAFDALKREMSFDQNEQVATMLDAISSAWRSLAARSWTVVELDHMVTSDFPVLINQSPELARLGVGIGNATEVAFALGPAHALVLSKPYGGPDRRVSLGPDGESYLRQTMWRMADRFTFRRPGAPTPSGIDLRERVVWGLRPRH